MDPKYRDVAAMVARLAAATASPRTTRSPTAGQGVTPPRRPRRPSAGRSRRGAAKAAQGRLRSRQEDGAHDDYLDYFELTPGALLQRAGQPLLLQLAPSTRRRSPG